LKISALAGSAYLYRYAAGTHSNSIVSACFAGRRHVDSRRPSLAVSSAREQEVGAVGQGQAIIYWRCAHVCHCNQIVP
jgi:hypothetical protein